MATIVERYVDALTNVDVCDEVHMLNFSSTIYLVT